MLPSCCSHHRVLLALFQWFACPYTLGYGAVLALGQLSFSIADSSLPRIPYVAAPKLSRSHDPSTLSRFPILSCLILLNTSPLVPITPPPARSATAFVRVGPSARQDLIFFARCLAPLAGVVANSAPAAAAWYDLLNAKTLLGTGLPNHPWVVGTDSIGGVSTTCRPVVDATRGAVAVGQPGEMLENVGGHNSAATEGWGNQDGEAALFLAMTSAADKDEWSAMLVSGGLVQSLVNSLQACFDFRTAVQGLDTMKAWAAAGKFGSSAQGGNSSSSSSDGGGTDSFRRANRPLREEAASGAAQNAKSPRTGGVGAEVLSDGCLGRELETAQVLVVVALGALLSAHPLAARDRFQLSGGTLRVHRAIFQQPKDSRAEETRKCVSYRQGCSDTPATSASPFLQEHCALVALQVLRLCLRADDDVEQLPPDVLEGALKLVGALSPSLRMAWDKGRATSHVTRGGLADEARHVGLPHIGERVQDGGPEVGGNGFDGLGGLSHRFLPLGLLEEVPVPVPVHVPEARVTFSVPEETETGADSGSAGVASLSEGTATAAGAKPGLIASSYRLCG